MDFRKLKDLVRKLGGLLVLDNDEPAFVVLTYDKYHAMDSGEEIPVSKHNVGADELDVMNGIDDEEATVQKLNREILALKEEIKQKEEAELANGQTIEVTDAIDPMFSD